MEEKRPVAAELGRMLGKRVIARVKDGRKLQGTLREFDDYMNLVLEDVEEYAGDELRAKYKLIMLKGGNLQSIEI
jgi:small nuclear ribonucleoprotein (snRNP)-like protein